MSKVDPEIQNNFMLAIFVSSPQVQWLKSSSQDTRNTPKTAFVWPNPYDRKFSCLCCAQILTKKSEKFRDSSNTIWKCAYKISTLYISFCRQDGQSIKILHSLIRDSTFTESEGSRTCMWETNSIKGDPNSHIQLASHFFFWNTLLNTHNIIPTT